MEKLKNIPLRNPKPDVDRFIGQLMGRVDGRPRLVEYLVDETVMRPVVTGLLGRAWVAEAYGREQIAFLISFSGIAWVISALERSMVNATLLAPDTAPGGQRPGLGHEHVGTSAPADFERYPWPVETDFFLMNTSTPSSEGMA
jgi:hypothetical protein